METNGMESNVGNTFLCIGALLALLILIVVLTIFQEARKKRCPFCRAKGKEILRESKPRRWWWFWSYLKITYKCDNCGGSWVEEIVVGMLD